MRMQRGIFNFYHPMDHREMLEMLDGMRDRYPFLEFASIGESILGKMLPVVTIGCGRKAALYVGTQGTDWSSTLFLLRFLYELGELYQCGGSAFGYSIPYLLSERRLYLIPMLNPDGVEYRLHGVSAENPLYERLQTMNGGALDFSSWQANARGVSLSHNYAIGFAEYKSEAAAKGIHGGAPNGFGGEMSESEPEVGALCNFLRYHEEIRGVLSLCGTGERIEYRETKLAASRVKGMAAAFSRMSGYRLCEREVARGELCDFCMEECGVPCFSAFCGRGEVSTSLGEWFGTYTAIRELLFSFSVML